MSWVQRWWKGEGWGYERDEHESVVWCFNAGYLLQDVWAISCQVCWQQKPKRGPYTTLEWYLCLNPYHNHKHSVWNSKFLHNHLHWRLEILKCPENLTYLLWTMGSYMRQIVLLIGYSTSAISVFFFFFLLLCLGNYCVTLEKAFGNIFCQSASLSIKSLNKGWECYFPELFYLIVFV